MRYVFGNCQLDLKTYTLRRAEQMVRLRPKAFQVLVYLLIHRDRVVSKQELCDQVWLRHPESISDSTLESTLTAVRQAIGDEGRAQRSIQTFYGLGYRFIAPAQEFCDSPPNVVAGALLLPGAASGMPTAPWTVSEGEASARRTACSLERPMTRSRCSLRRQRGHRPAPQALISECKLVSVVCCAVSPAAGVALQDDLDACYERVQTAYRLVQPTVQQYGGTLLPVVDETMVAVFGIPMAHGDHARRAVLAALSLWQTLRRHRANGSGALGEGMAVRLGAHTGLAALGNPNDAAVAVIVGDTVSLALTLQNAAVPGAILCSDATARLVRGEVDLEFQGAVLERRHGRGAVLAYQVRGLRPHRTSDSL